tara:strand:- start:164 stop:526 length:363 start_codon:yes stop_codon:yes gene_type:complete
MMPESEMNDAWHEAQGGHDDPNAPEIPEFVQDDRDKRDKERRDKSWEREQKRKQQRRNYWGEDEKKSRAEHQENVGAANETREGLSQSYMVGDSTGSDSQSMLLEEVRALRASIESLLNL